jgi:hypothetical protein
LNFWCFVFRQKPAIVGTGQFAAPLQILLLAMALHLQTYASPLPCRGLVMMSRPTA